MAPRSPFVKLKYMKTLFTMLGVAALLCGCHTQKNSGGTMQDNDSRFENAPAASGQSSRTDSGLSQTNSNTQGAGAEKLNNDNTPAKPSNP